MKELINAIAASNNEQKVLLLLQFLEYGESGINYLIKCLEDSELEIRAKAYEILQDVESEKARKAIANGLLLNPGDIIYHVLTRNIWFNDSFFSLSSLEDNNDLSRLTAYKDYLNQGYKIIRFAEAAYIATEKNCYFKLQQAELKAKSIHLENITKISISEFEVKEDREVIKQWCNRYQISTEIWNFHVDKQIKLGWDKWQESYEMPDPRSYIYWFTVEEYLRNIGNLDLLSQLWEDCVGKLAYVHHVCFDKKTYLSINRADNHATATSKKVYIHFDGGDGKQSVSERQKYRDKSVKIIREDWQEDIPF